MDKLIKILIIVTVLGLTAYVVYDQVEKWYKRRLDTALEYERKGWEEKKSKLEEKITTLQEELAQHREAIVPKEKLLEVFGEESMMISPEQREISCEELKSQIMAFFTYLDKKRYRETYELKEGMYELFQQVTSQLSINLPLVTGEMKSLSILMRNVAHFYRVLGRRRIGLIKEIIKNETEIIESVMATFYLWFISNERRKEATEGSPSLEVLYEYAGFFLNTLAGKSYLLRRNSKLRVLTNYYCVLIVDKANEETLNRYGIDIRPHIDFLYYEISNQRGLIYKKQYLAKLEGLKEKYQI